MYLTCQVVRGRGRGGRAYLQTAASNSQTDQWRNGKNPWYQTELSREGSLQNERKVLPVYKSVAVILCRGPST